MSGVVWIICEREPRWAPAVRVALAGHPSAAARQISLREIRHLVEIDVELRNNAACGFFEVSRENLDEVLPWLAAQKRSSGAHPNFALLDRNLTPDRGPANSIIAAALLEAGAADVADSPLQLRHVLHAALKHSMRQMRPVSFAPASAETFENWALSLLPWQDAR